MLKCWKPTTLPLCVIREVFHCQIDLECVPCTERDVWANLFNVNVNIGTCSLKPKSICLIRWVYCYFIQSNLENITDSNKHSLNMHLVQNAQYYIAICKNNKIAIHLNRPTCTIFLGTWRAWSIAVLLWYITMIPLTQEADGSQ